MVAARKGEVEIVRKLIQHGANVNITNEVTDLEFVPNRSNYWPHFAQ